MAKNPEIFAQLDRQRQAIVALFAALEVLKNLETIFPAAKKVFRIRPKLRPIVAETEKNMYELTNLCRLIFANGLNKAAWAEEVDRADFRRKNPEGRDFCENGLSGEPGTWSEYFLFELDKYPEFMAEEEEN